MKNLKIFISFFLLSLSVASTFAQNVSGVVYTFDEQNKKEPLPGVNLYWEGTQKGTVSDMDGNFSIKLPASKNLSLVASFVGFKNDTIIVNGEEKIEIVLASTQELDEYVVNAKQKSSFVSQLNPLYVQNITKDELQKAACCSLSESFETNASVDVSYSDAVSGAKKIELLGLHGKYVQMMTENIPNLRGLSTPYALSYIPGTWMESIQVSKGASSVVNGYESTTGQINVEYKKPDDSDKLFLNLYVNSMTKMDANFDAAVRVNEKWSTMIFGHFENLQNKIDNNKDGFLDATLIRQYNFYNRWKYRNGNHIAQFGLKVLDENRDGGQVKFDKNALQEEQQYYGINVKTRRYEAWGKTGYVFGNRNESNLGFINGYSYHHQKSFFGINDYEGTQNNYYANLIFQSNLGSHQHSYSTGASYNYDRYEEVLNDSTFNRTEQVPGLFFQYTYSNENNLTVLLGIRSDFHNIYGTFYTPRFHAKYNLTKNTILRGSAGKGYRSANVIAENSYLLATSRNLVINEELKMEEAWNYGLNLTQIFDIRGKEMNINIEFYHTDFEHQVIIDRDQNVRQVNLYNLDGKSYSNSAQIEIVYEVIPRFDVVAAFRYSDVKMTTNGILKREPFVNRYKGLLNLSYKTNLEKWQFDFTTVLNGDARIPTTEGNPDVYQRAESSPVYAIINGQIAKNFKKWKIYLGVENLTDFTQSDPIIAADDPFGEYFDSSMIWGPVMGRKIYAGINIIIN
jgi:outer membrane receptor for ferrienterochelin and colicin